jgi:hypothetical protein
LSRELLSTTKRRFSTIGNRTTYCVTKVLLLTILSFCSDMNLIIRHENFCLIFSGVIRYVDAPMKIVAKCWNTLAEATEPISSNLTNFRDEFNWIERNAGGHGAFLG